MVFVYGERSINHQDEWNNDAALENMPKSLQLYTKKPFRQGYDENDNANYSANWFLSRLDWRCMCCSGRR